MPLKNPGESTGLLAWLYSFEVTPSAVYEGICLRWLGSLVCVCVFFGGSLLSDEPTEFAQRRVEH